MRMQIDCTICQKMITAFHNQIGMRFRKSDLDSHAMAAGQSIFPTANAKKK